ncbi:hypothetical protein BH10ACT2_BH10ACT2_20950 [soil metagenome]
MSVLGGSFSNPLAAHVRRVRVTAFYFLEASLWTISNVLLALFLAHTASTSDFGSISATYLAMSFSQQAAQAYFNDGEVSQALVGSRVPLDRRHVGGGAIFGIGGAPITLVVGLATGCQVSIVLVFVVAGPWLISQDQQRFAALRQDRFATAIGAQVVWVSSFLLAGALMYQTGMRTPLDAVIAWTLSGLCAFAFCCRIASLQPFPVSRSFAGIRQTARKGIPLVLEHSAVFLSQFGLVIFLAAAISTDKAAAYRGAQTLAVFASVAATAFRFMALRYSASHSMSGHWARTGLILALSGAAFAFALGLPILAIPYRLGSALLGTLWLPSMALFPIVLVHKAATAATLGYIAVGRKMLPVRDVIGARSWLSALSATAAAAVAATFGTLAAVCTLVGGSLLLCLVLHRQLNIAQRSSP